MKTIDFDEWWFNGGYEKAEIKCGKSAQQIANNIDPTFEVINIYSDTLEKLARDNNMHLISEKTNKKQKYPNHVTLHNP